MHLKNLRIRGGLILGKENINIKYEHQNNSNYLVIEDNVEYDDYQYKMLRRNKPEHFLRFSMYSVNGRYGIYYDITSRQQLSKYYEYGKMTMEDVKSICVNISQRLMDIVLTKALKYCLNLYWNILIIVWIRRVSYNYMKCIRR